MSSVKWVRPAIPELADPRSRSLSTARFEVASRPGIVPLRQIGKGRVAAGFRETIAKSRQNDALQAQEALGSDPWQIGKTNAARGLQAETTRGDPPPGCGRRGEPVIASVGTLPTELFQTVMLL